MKCLFVALALFSVLFAVVSASTYNETVGSTTCGGNCPGGCDSCPCGTTKSMQDITSWCAKYSGWSQSQCQCIAKAESGGNANAVNQNTGSSAYKWDVGLWQINSYNWDACSGGSAPCDTSKNLECAKKVFAWGGNTFKLWSTCGQCGAC
jgi:hypothetical protein